MKPELLHAQVCCLTYIPNANYELIGYKLVTSVSTFEDNAVILSNDDSICIAIRGSDDLQDWIDNLEASSVSIPKVGRIHEGFADSFFGCKSKTKYRVKWLWKCIPYIKRYKRDSFDGLFQVLDKEFVKVYSNNKKLIITGHSKGGALAELLALKYSQLGYKLDLYTYGCPKVGFESYKNTFESYNINYLRFVNERDIVPDLPPFGKFVHVVKPIRIGSSGIAIFLMQGVFEHTPSRYISALQRIYGDA